MTGHVVVINKPVFHKSVYRGSLAGSLHSPTDRIVLASLTELGDPAADRNWLAVRPCDESNPQSAPQPVELTVRPFAEIYHRICNIFTFSGSQTMPMSS